jgi:peroxiredoxin
MIGTEAPDFTRKASNTGEDISLSALRGKPVLLVFHPFAFTGICQEELCSIRDDPSRYAGGAQVVVVSCDPAPTQKAWAEQQGGWTFPVVSDFWPHGEIARAYGAFNEERGCANRVTVVIGADGTIVDRFDTPDLGTARTVERYAEAIAKL